MHTPPPTRDSVSSTVPIKQPYGVLLVDDHELVRLGLRTLMLSHASSGGVDLQVFEARTLQEALLTYRSHRSSISLVMLDLHLPDAHGLTGLQSFMSNFNEAHVAVLSAVNNPALMRDALALGASAYLTKADNLEHVVSYISAQGVFGNVKEKESNFADLENTLPQPADVPARQYRSAAGKPLQLGNRQIQVLDWVLAGKNNRQIAQMTSLSEGTIRNYVSMLLLQFGVRSRAQLISLLR